MTEDCNGRTLKVGHIVAVLGQAPTWIFSIMNINEKGVLRLGSVYKGLELPHMYRKANNVRKLRIEELI